MGNREGNRAKENKKHTSQPDLRKSLEKYSENPNVVSSDNIKMEDKARGSLYFPDIWKRFHSIVNWRVRKVMTQLKE